MILVSWDRSKDLRTKRRAFFRHQSILINIHNLCPVYTAGFSLMESPILLLTSNHLSIEMYSSYSNKLQIILQQKLIRKYQSFCGKLDIKVV